MPTANSAGGAPPVGKPGHVTVRPVGKPGAVVGTPS